MPIKVKTPSATLSTSINKEIDERVIGVIINTLKYVGEQCIKEARDGGTYTDRTANLRSSTGYVILRDGKVVSKGLDQDPNATDEGRKAASTLLDQLSDTDKSSGITLIVVAGMKYAYYVEKIHNRVVLSSAELLADQLVPQLLTQLGFIVKK